MEKGLLWLMAITVGFGLVASVLLLITPYVWRQQDKYGTEGKIFATLKILFKK